MPTNRKNINPLDLRPRVAVGVNIPFSEPSAITPNYTTQEAIKNNIINFILTNQNERLYRPNFGADLRSRMFSIQDQDEMEALGDEIKFSLELEFPTVKVNDISFKPDQNENSINFFITYILATGTTDSISITL
jgi:phage baseplate assembly protein W